MRRIAILALLVVLTACSVAPPVNAPLAASGLQATAAAATPTPKATMKPAPTLPPTPTEIPYIRKIGVILGTDGRPDVPGYGIRTDTFVIAVADIPEIGPVRLTLIAVPRDLFVPVPCEIGYPEGETPMNRVNAAWYRGGFECVAETVKATFGLDVNAPIILADMADVTKVIDSLGGVVLTPDTDYFDKCGDSEMFWGAGEPYQLSGAGVLCYVRGRNAYGGDIDRGRRAIEIIKAATEQWPKKLLYDPKRALDVFSQFYSSGLLSTSATLPQIAELLGLLPKASDVKIKTVNMVVDDVDFASHPLYGSILLPRLDLPNWAICVIETEHAGVCADTWRYGP